MATASFRSRASFFSTELTALFLLCSVTDNTRARTMATCNSFYNADSCWTRLLQNRSDGTCYSTLQVLPVLFSAHVSLLSYQEQFTRLQPLTTPLLKHVCSAHATTQEKQDLISNLCQRPGVDANNIQLRHSVPRPKSLM
eukprot:6474417-Amphidinium_carterae.1